MKANVLFVCIHNSARSQIADAYLKKLGGNDFKSSSAGLEPDKLNPLAVEVMKEEGIDISKNQITDVFDLFKKGMIFSHVISVCDEASAERCPIFPGVCKRISWSFNDPSSFTGTHEEKLIQTRIVRDKIKDAIKNLIEEINSKHPEE